jgi:hypothetical protein
VSDAIGQGSVRLEWGDGEHAFRLAIGQLRELQESVNRPRVAMGAPAIGPRTLLRLLSAGDAWPDEVAEVLRLGLVGGGMKPVEAARLVRLYVNPPERPVLESAPVAQVVLMAALVGVRDDPVGKKPRRRRRRATTASASPASTASAPQSDSLPGRSTSAPSGSSPLASTAGTTPTAPTVRPSP